MITTGATREIRNTVVVGRLIPLVVVTNAVVRVKALTLFRPEGFFTDPPSHLAKKMSKMFNKFKTVHAGLAQTAQVDQLFQLLNLIRIYDDVIYELPRTLMSKNVNNDLSTLPAKMTLDHDHAR